MILVIAGVSPIGLLIVVGMILAIFHPKRLQPEEWQNRDRALQIIYEKGSRIKVDAASLEIIAASSAKELPSSKVDS